MASALLVIQRFADCLCDILQQYLSREESQAFHHRLIATGILGYIVAGNVSISYQRRLYWQKHMGTCCQLGLHQEEGDANFEARPSHDGHHGAVDLCDGAND